jgi:hypothetical protein
MAANTQIVSPLQVYKAPKSWAGLIDTARLTDALQTEPHKMGMFMAYHFGYEYNNFLNLITGGLGQTKIIESSTYDWNLHSQNMRALPLLDNMESGNTTPGFGGMPFRVIFSEKYFDVTDVLISDDRTQCRIITEPQAGPSGGYVYTLQLMKANRNAFIDPSQIARGARFSKMFSVVAEGSDRGGSTTYHNPFLLKNQLTTLRKQFEITGSAAVEKMVFEIPYDGGKKTAKYWCTLAEYTAMNQFYAEVDKALFYGEYNRTSDNTVVPKDLNGRPIFIGAGLREQIAPANRRYYSSLTYNILEDFLMDLSYNRKEWGGNMRFLALTGKMGMVEFDRAITDKARTFSNLIISDGGRFISGTGMDLTFGSQFKTVKFPNGIELTVANFEPYDDLTDNRILHPVSQRPIESYRFTIMNIGQKEGNKANIQKVVKRDREMVMWSENGSIDIGGTHAKSLNQGRSNAKDGAVGHILSECGIMLGDPTSCGELILNIE